MRLHVLRDLTPLDIVCRITRHEDMLTGLLSSGVLDLAPFHGRTPWLTQCIEWNLRQTILSTLFDADTCQLRPLNEAALVRRFRVYALLNLLLSPLVVGWLLLYLVLRNAEKAYSHPATIWCARKAHRCRQRQQEPRTRTQVLTNGPEQFSALEH
jgi:autophagy-related protein 9